MSFKCYNSVIKIKLYLIAQLVILTSDQTSKYKILRKRGNDQKGGF